MRFRNMTKHLVNENEILQGDRKVRRDADGTV